VRVKGGDVIEATVAGAATPSGHVSAAGSRFGMEGGTAGSD